MKPVRSEPACYDPPSDTYDLSDEEVREALLAYMREKGAETTGTVFINYPGRDRPYHERDKLSVTIIRDAS